MSLATRTCGGRAARAAAHDDTHTRARRDRRVYIGKFRHHGLQQRPFTPRRPVNALKRKVNGKRFLLTFCVALCGLWSTALRIQA
eukprot:scaffold27339_cov56-Phaeocystis_antarctica.AAC.1